MRNIPVEEQDLSELVWLAINKGLTSHPYFADPAIALARKYWKDVAPYYQRKIICDVQVAIALDGTSATRRLDGRDKWQKFAQELEPPRAQYTIKYHCHKCKKKDLKLWRPVHGGEVNGHGLLCAMCLAPGVVVDSHGKYDSPEPHSVRTDQVNGWLPAVPVDDTFWGYTSVPSADLRWWKGLPTYTK